VERIKLFDESAVTGAGRDILGLVSNPLVFHLLKQRKNSRLLPHISPKTREKVELKVVSDYEGILRDMGRASQFYFITPITYIIATKSMEWRSAKALTENHHTSLSSLRVTTR
jgi:hypothetical protein